MAGRTSATAARLLLAAVLLLALAANHNASATFDEDKLEVINEVVAEVKAVKLAILCAKAKKFWINLDICNNTKPNITCEQCGAGFQLINGQCAPCGTGFACPDGCTRFPCNDIFESTPNDTSAECLPLSCNTCPSDTPTIYFSVRQAPFATPPGGLFRVKDFQAGVTGLVPEFLCQLSLQGSVGVNDVALTGTGDLLVIDNGITLGYLPKDRIPTAATPIDSPTLPQCDALPIVDIPEIANNVAALGVGKKSNLVYIGGSNGNVQAISFKTVGGNLTYQVQAPVNVPCGPDQPGKLGQSVDVIIGPDNGLYRWCGANTNTGTPYSGTRFELNLDGTISQNSAYVSKGLSTIPDSDYSGGGTFCIPTTIIGQALDNKRPGNNGAMNWYTYGLGGSAATPAALTSSSIGSGANSTQWFVSGTTNPVTCSFNN